ncbi:MAG: acylneuraminate cytidylyltransferase family protein [Sedimentibacter saalensis]|uniref:acylneuraminate cytidylyltransferase family protein n=1 Tax=Sedimentibacter saalensis TaxID=130788 RepID=UPI002B211DC1|nr:acylneuraminate cytidylyltransferase family protein [Sedimentibacter saalensis]MEA5095139.1 acylneuraminate cytidylyltransferase family protein [Sedimentibacter saalensis]
MIGKNILCIIPARGGSKGVHRKNIRNLGNKPLIQWTIDEAKKSKYISRIVISTEDKEIEEVCTEIGAEVIKRPIELATDDSPTIDSILYTLNILEDNEEFTPDYVMLLQCTSPFRTVTAIDASIETLLSDSKNSKSLISVTKEEHPPWWLKSINADGTLKDFILYDKKQYSRRQSFPPVYRLNGAIYICDINELKKNRSFETDKTLAYIMDSYSSMDIDTEEDLSLAEYILKKISKNTKLI